ncbi:MAG: ACT domain-containing protein [Leptolyngbyaceae cyanobacterium]
MASLPGEIHLKTLLANMQPKLQPTVFVFATIARASDLPTNVVPLCQFQEAEGTTLILAQADADRINLPYAYPCRMITLTIHSNLAAVGLIATVTQALAAMGISTNVISAYFHDHIFVPQAQAAAAIACLKALAASAGN